MLYTQKLIVGFRSSTLYICSATMIINLMTINYMRTSNYNFSLLTLLVVTSTMFLYSFSDLNTQAQIALNKNDSMLKSAKRRYKRMLRKKKAQNLIRLQENTCNREKSKIVEYLRTICASIISFIGASIILYCLLVDNECYRMSALIFTISVFIITMLSIDLEPVESPHIICPVKTKWKPHKPKKLKDKDITQQQHDIFDNFVKGDIRQINYDHVKSIDFKCSNEQVKLFKGAIQSIKSRILIVLTYYSILNKSSVLLVSDGKNDSMHQLRKGYSSFYSDYLKYVQKTYPHTEPIKQISITLADEENKLEEAYNNIKKGVPQVIISIRHAVQLKRVNDNLFDGSFKFNLFSDESDTFQRNDRDTLYLTPYSCLIDKCNILIGVTATVWDIILCNDLKRRLKVGDIHLLESPLNYKGIDSFNKVKIVPNSDGKYYSVSEGKIEYCDDVKEKLNGLFIDIIEPIRTIITTDEISRDYLHPLIVLIRGPTEKKDLDAEQTKFRSDYPNAITIVYYGDTNLPVYIPNITVVKYESETIRIFTDGLFYFPHAMRLGEILQCLKSNLSAFNCTHICIFAGHMANRSINFASNDHEWNLTHQFNVSADTDLAQLMQSHRLCARSNDNIQRTLYTSLEKLEQLDKSIQIEQKLFEVFNKYPADKHIDEILIENSEIIPASLKPKGVRITHPCNKTVPIKNLFEKPPQSIKIKIEVGDIFNVSENKQAPEFTRKRDSIISYLSTRRGVWYNRTDIFRQFTTNKVEIDNYCGIIHIDRIKKGVTRASNENEPGFLMRLKGRSWQIRYN